MGLKQKEDNFLRGGLLHETLVRSWLSQLTLVRQREIELFSFLQVKIVETVPAQKEHQQEENRLVETMRG